MGVGRGDLGPPKSGVIDGGDLPIVNHNRAKIFTRFSKYCLDVNLHTYGPDAQHHELACGKGAAIPPNKS